MPMSQSRLRDKSRSSRIFDTGAPCMHASRASHEEVDSYNSGCGKNNSEGICSTINVSLKQIQLNPSMLLQPTTDRRLLFTKQRLQYPKIT
ncbi:hypothetical protein G6F57_021309 [Rhizopus arrhizus]|nr:hypothetical protein G6F58_013319 [Rhizopus delemar]KAG1435046.1 hypothetical protein G6F57_021309 [Rhizopus arrhizus]